MGRTTRTGPASSSSWSTLGGAVVVVVDVDVGDVAGSVDGTGGEEDRLAEHAGGAG